MPHISVIINVLDGEATLAQAIDSVLAQTVSDFELLIWDDASTDSSSELVGKYHDTRIRYFRSDMRVSLGRARQAAIELAQGQWIAFLDQDDIWLPRKLELQLARANKPPEAALIYGRTVRFYTNGLERDYDQAHEYKLLPEGDIFPELFAKSCFIAMSSAIFRRSALGEISGVAQWVNLIPDYYLYTAITRRFPAAAVQEVVCRYRMHGANASQTAAVEMHREALQLMDFWSEAVGPVVLQKCKRHHSTQIALAELQQPGSFFSGLKRLVKDGSVSSQVVRPFYFLSHLIRRNVVKPYWRKLA